ncbi:MAG TPA: hypothetical protein VM616_08550, partial [Gammaproteobacteria bacterium]|nr:hypothetical protein [Gammaproteobacteria bacterium]
MISRERAVEEAARLMLGFAHRTGLIGDGPQQRYLWTDAFAVCNFLALARATGEARHTDLALRLIDDVHRALGRFRDDDPRRGWLSGLGEAEGAAHPTRGGLRIGKRLAERTPDQPYDERLEWERDGQYFHYLTKWMHALDQAARQTGQARFNLWARELAETTHRVFVFERPGRSGRHMAWKMSTDLSRPLVASMGQHDPLDGYITCVQLRATASMLESGKPAGPGLDEAIADFAAMIEGGDLTTADALGLGSLLMDAARVDQLTKHGAIVGGHLLERLLTAAFEGLSHYARLGELQRPASQRLAFRELGLAIGLSAVGVIGVPSGGAGGELQRWIDRLKPYLALAAGILAFWLDDAHRTAPPWPEHRDINEVMLA